jgi:hypothetical protein
VRGQQKMHQQEPATIQQIIDKYSLRILKQNNEFTAGKYHNFGKPKGEGFHDAKLMVFKNDTLIYSIKNLAKDYCWIKDNNLIYLLTDTIIAAGLGAPATEIGIFYSDSLTHETLIDLGTKDTYLTHVNYTQFNKKVYVKNLNRVPEVFELDIKNKQLIPTNYKGLNFSPNGRYYTNFSYEGEPISLCERTSNTIIWEGKNSIDAEEKMRFLEFFSWYLDGETTFLYLQNRYGVARINCRTGEMVKFYTKPERGMKPVLKSNGNIQWK